MRRLLPVLLLCSACVVRYGENDGNVDEAAAQARKAQYAELSRQLDDLLADVEGVDQRDRIDAAWRLAERLEAGESHEAVQAYLKELVRIESRSLPTAVEAVEKDGSLGTFTPVGTTIEEETLGTADPPAADPGWGSEETDDDEN